MQALKAAKERAVWQTKHLDCSSSSQKQAPTAHAGDPGSSGHISGTPTHCCLCKIVWFVSVPCSKEWITRSNNTQEELKLPNGRTWRVLSHLLMQWKWKAWLQTPAACKTYLIRPKYLMNLKNKLSQISSHNGKPWVNFACHYWVGTMSNVPIIHFQLWTWVR